MRGTFAMPVKRTTVKAHSTNYYVGRRAPVQFIVIHDGETGEGSTPAEGMGSWFAQDHGSGGRSSAHRGADTDSICTYVADKDTAFGAPGVNASGWHLEHAGRASQTVSQWDDEDSRLILVNGALAAAEASVRLAPLTVDRKPIPAVWLTDAQLRAAQTNPRIKGFITHRQVTRVLKNGTHTDPGPNFPADRYMTLVRSHLSGTNPVSEEDDMPSAKEVADEILKRPVVDLDGKRVTVGQAIGITLRNSALSGRLAKAQAELGRPLTVAEIDDIAAAAAAATIDALDDDYTATVTLTPKES